MMYCSRLISSSAISTCLSLHRPRGARVQTSGVAWSDSSVAARSMVLVVGGRVCGARVQLYYISGSIPIGAGPVVLSLRGYTLSG